MKKLGWLALGLALGWGVSLAWRMVPWPKVLYEAGVALLGIGVIAGAFSGAALVSVVLGQWVLPRGSPSDRAFGGFMCLVGLFCLLVIGGFVGHMILGK